MESRPRDLGIDDWGLRQVSFRAVEAIAVLGELTALCVFVCVCVCVCVGGGRVHSRRCFCELPGRVVIRAFTRRVKR